MPNETSYRDGICYNPKGCGKRRLLMEQYNSTQNSSIACQDLIEPIRTACIIDFEASSANKAI